MRAKSRVGDLELNQESETRPKQESETQSWSYCYSCSQTKFTFLFSLASAARLASVYSPSPSSILTEANGIWLYIIGFFTGIVATFTITILVGWLIDTAAPHSSWWNKAFYGYALGCRNS